MNDIQDIKSINILSEKIINDERFIVICAWCNPTVKVWQGATLSHGICNQHRQQMMDELKQLKNNAPDLLNKKPA